MKTNLLYSLYFCFVLFLLPSCDKGEVYYDFKELKNGQWAVGDNLKFEIDSFTLNRDMAYDISLEVTNNVGYPYQNLWLVMEYVVNDSVTIQKEREFILTTKDGVWIGEGFGSLFQSSHRVESAYRFRDIDNLSIYIRHGMTDSVLNGIERVGIKIKETE